MYFLVKVVKANGDVIMLFTRNSSKKFKMGHLTRHGRFSVKESSPISTLLSNQDIIDTLIEKTSTEIKERLLEQRDALIVSGNIFLVIDYKAAKLFKSP